MAEVSTKEILPENDLTLFTIKKMQEQCAELAQEFEEALKEQQGQLGIISDRSFKLMQMFEKDADDVNEQVNQSLENLEEFKTHFREIQGHFSYVHQLNAKSKQMAEMCDRIVKNHEKKIKKK